MTELSARSQTILAELALSLLGEAESPAVLLGRLIRLARVSTGMDQRVFAAKVSVSQATLSRLERGEGSLARCDLGAWAAALGLPVQILERAVEGCLVESGGESVDRREFFSAAAFLTSPAAGQLGENEVARIETAVQGLIALDDAQGGDQLVKLAVHHFERVRDLLGQPVLNTKLSQRLLAAAGRLAEHTGWLCVDAYRHADARVYFNEALLLAGMGMDRDLEVLALAGVSMQARHAQRPRESQLAAAEARVRAASWGPSRLISELWVREAYALAQQRDPQFRRALASASREYQRSDAPIFGDWWAFYDDAHWLVSEASVFGAAGEHRTAVTIWARALAAHDPSYTRNHALYHVAYADDLVRIGQFDQATQAASTGAALLRHDVTSARTRYRLRHLIGRFQQHRDVRCIRDFLDQYGTAAA